MNESHRYYNRIEEKHRTELDFYERRAIETLESPVRTILEQLRPYIEKGVYRIVLGDDASGRVPAIIVANALKKIYAARGTKPPLVRFVAGTRFLEDDALERKKAKLDSYTAEMKKTVLKGLKGKEGKEGSLPEGLSQLSDEERDSRVLVVSDYVATGTSLKPLINSLKEGGVAADIAAVGLDDDFEPDEAGFHVTAAGRRGEAPNIYGKEALSGVIKDPGDLFATRAVPPKTYQPKEFAPTQQKINATREIAADIANRVAEEFLSEKSDV